MKLIFDIKIIISVLLILFTHAFANTNKSGVNPNVISLPSGPGSIEGLGESFEPQLNSGTSTYKIPLIIPPGRNGFAPDIVLVYNSGNGNSKFGLGWKIDLPYIQRQTDKGQPFYTLWPDADGIDNNKNDIIDEYDEFDTIIYSNGEELVPTKKNFWRCENESDFIRFERYSQGWRGKQNDGTILIFGTSNSSRIQDSNGNIFKWCIEEIIDTNGNKINFFYDTKDSTSQLYCSKIVYNTKNSSSISIHFVYEKRPDIIVDFRPGFELKTSFRCTHIKIFERNNHVRTYWLEYEKTTNDQPLSLLSTVTQVGADGISQLPSATFSYVSFSGHSSTPQINTLSPNIDINDNNIEFIDLNSDSLPDILNTNQNPHYYYLNLGPDSDGMIRWLKRERMSTNILKFLSSNSVKLADMDADGSTELLNLQGHIVRYFGIDSSLNWELKGDIRSTGSLTFDPSVRLIDANNDKRIDIMQTTTSHYFVWINQKDNTWSNRFTTASTDLKLQFNKDTTKIADMNGDRIPDIVHLQKGVCFYYPGKGYGKYANRIRMKNPPDDIFDESNFIVADVNGDGLSDVVHVGSRIKVWLNLGITPDDHSFGRFASSFTIKTSTIHNSQSFRQLDINGNGSVDIVWTAYHNNRNMLAFLDFSNDEQPYQIKTISNGIGRTTTVYYRSSVTDMVKDRDDGNPWPDKLPFPIQVVSKIETHDGMNAYSTQFVYHDGYYDSEEKEFRGFAGVEKIEVGDKITPDLIMTHKFDTGVKNDSLKGKVLEIEAQTQQKEIFYREEFRWETRNVAESIDEDERTVSFPYNHKKDRTILEKGIGEPVQIVWEYEYDNYGNTIRQLEHGRIDKGWDDERIIEIEFSSNYLPNIKNWILNKKINIKTTDENGTLVAHKRYYYDNSLTPGYIRKGNLTRVEDWIKDDTYIVSVRNKYDNYGNIIAIYDSLYGSKPGHFREIEYDDIYKTYPVKEIIYTGNEKLPELSVSTTYDSGFGVIRFYTDFNGFITEYKYDTFSRLTSIKKPPDDTNTIEYGYVLAHKINNNPDRIVNWIETRQRDENSDDGYLKYRDFFDGMGRKIMTLSEGATPGQVIVKDTVQYNARSFIWKKYLPYFETGTLDFQEPVLSNHFTEHFYDALGREIKTNQPLDNGNIVFSTITFKPLIKIVQDEEQNNPESPHFGCKKKYVEDGLLDENGKGRLRQVFEVVKIDDFGEPLQTPVEWQTTYSYDLLKNLINYTDAQDNQKVFQYDGLGRKTYMNDPDRGQMFYEYDSESNLIKTTDAKTQIIRYEYDGVNRLIAEYSSKNNKIPDVQYHYDLPYGSLTRGEYWNIDLEELIKKSILNMEQYASEYDLNSDFAVDVSDIVKATKSKTKQETVTAKNTKGQLSWVQDQSGEEHISYDSRARKKWKIKRIIENDKDNLKNFYSEMQYDSMDRVTKQIYPDATEIKYIYNTRGLLDSISGVIDHIDYKPTGQIDLLKLACGAVTNYDYDHRFRLKQLKTDRPRDNLVLQDLNYSYDGVSNIISITDRRSENDFKIIANELNLSPQKKYKFHATQYFNYDSLYRLTKASNQTIYGTINYRYDRIGNMVSKQANLKEPDALMNLGTMKSGGMKGTWSRIGRNPDDMPGPHAITETEKGPAGSLSFRYDNNGNMISNQGMTFQWDYHDRMIGVINDTIKAKYLYDYNGTRTKKQVLNGKNQQDVFYINKLSEVRQGKLLKYVYVGMNRVARFNENHEKIFFFHDHLGSTSFVISDVGEIREHIVNYPFGRKRFNLNSLYSNYYIFTGKELDTESELMYFEARYYDPVVGRFVSVDPLYENISDEWLISSQSLNLLMYCKNNPILYKDPNGLWAIIDDLVFMAGGAIVGVVGRGVGDIISGKHSDFEDYIASIIGGAAGGEALLYMGAFGAGTIGGATTNVVEQGLKLAAGKQKDFSFTDFLIDTGIGTATGLIRGAKIPGITSGKGSMNAIFNQIITKASKGQISKISIKTALKMLIGRSTRTSLLPGAGAAAVASLAVDKAIEKADKFFKTEVSDNKLIKR